MTGFKGSTLLLAILVAGFITIVGLAISRLAVTEIRMSASVIDSLAAYYAAEACLEDGLWSWRNNRNVEQETPLNKDLGNGIGCQEKVWYKTGAGVGDFEDLRNSKILTKDQTWEMQADGLSQIRIKYMITKDYGQTANPDHGVEISYYNEILKKWETQFYNETRDTEAQIRDGITVLLPSTNTPIVRIKPWDADIQFAIKGPSDTKIDCGTHYIEATGYAPTVKRKLTAEIDRQSGTLANLYDFVIYSSGTLSQQ